MSDGGCAAGVNLCADLIGSAYEVGLEPEGWERFADQVRSAFHSELALVQVYDHDDPARSFVVAAGLGHDFLAAFHEHWGGFDGRDDDRIWRTVRSDTAGSVRVNVELQTLEEARRTEIHRVLAAPWGLEYFMTGVILNTPCASAFVSLGRTDAAGCFAPDEKRLLGGTLLGHLGRNLALRSQFARTRSRASVLGAVLDALPTGLLVFDRTGRPILVNRRAEELLGLGRAAALRQRRLVTDDPRAQRNLDHALALTLAADPCAGVPPAVVIRGGTGDLRFTFAPLRGRLRDAPLPVELPAHAACIAILEPLANNGPPGRSTLAGRFGFTPAEERVCQLLLTGHSLQEAADQLEISRNTAKTHLKRIFDKTGVRSQVSLIGLLRP